MLFSRCDFSMVWKQTDATERCLYNVHSAVLKYFLVTQAAGLQSPSGDAIKGPQRPAPQDEGVGGARGAASIAGGVHRRQS